MIKSLACLSLLTGADMYCGPKNPCEYSEVAFIVVSFAQHTGAGAIRSE
jgi:hypothetical protein